MQHVIYQVEYQKALKTQIQAILETLQTNEFETLSAYLAKSYEEGFLGTMYDLQGQGIPLVFPLDQAQIVDAIQTESKLSTRTDTKTGKLYASLGDDIKDLQKKIAGEISRGLSTGMMYSEIARNIASYLDNETLMQLICEQLDISYDDIKGKLPDPDEAQNAVTDAQGAIEGAVVVNE